MPKLQPVARDLSDQALDLIAARFRVLGEASRLKLIHALEAGEKSVTDLIEATGLSQANASRHLHTLTAAGILSRRKEGLKVLYSIADSGVFKLCEHVCGSVQKRLVQEAKAFD
jgi:DNA-binding transcriptional ArsR family regulator